MPPYFYFTSSYMCFTSRILILVNKSRQLALIYKKFYLQFLVQIAKIMLPNKKHK
jgi:hypothetical protein